MEIGCVWMRRLLFVGNTSPPFRPKPFAASSIVTLSRHPISGPSLPLTPLNLIYFPSSRRRWLSAASCSSAIPLVALELPPDFGGVECTGSSKDDKKVLLKGMTYTEVEKWVQSRGYRPGQALMLWKRLYGNNMWAHNCEELEGLNKDFKRMLSESVEFKALSLREIVTASDGTRKEVADSV